MANGWTQERRQKQSEAIRRWQPWANSTGPRTRKGKNKASQNAYKGSVRPMLREIARVLRAQESQLSEV